MLVSSNNYKSYTMVDVPPITDYKVVLPKGQFNGLREHYNIRTDPDLGLGWTALCWVACGCGPCRINSRGHGCHLMNPQRSHATLTAKSV